MLCCECGSRSQAEVHTPKSKRATSGALSPVSAYCAGELDPEEKKAFAQLQARNLELRWLAGVASATPEVDQQVEEHLARLRFAVAENARLRQDLVGVQASLVQKGVSLRGVPSPEDTRLSEEIRHHRTEQRELVDECARLSEAIQLELAGKQDVSARALQELHLAHEMQREELVHFRRLVQDKRQGTTSTPPQAPAADTGALLEAELEHLREHLAQVQQRGEEERAAADRQADELRQEMRTLEQELQTIRAEKEVCLHKLEDTQENGCLELQLKPSAAMEVKRVSGEGGAAAFASEGGRPHRLHGEALAKEIGRTRQRVKLLDAKIAQLEEEATDIRQRANLVLRAVPETPGGEETSEGDDKELRELLGSRQAELQIAKHTEEALGEELAKFQQALDAAKVEAAVMEQKMKLLKIRTGAAQF